MECGVVDMARLGHEAPKQNEFTKGKDKISTTKSPAYYLNDNEEKRKVYVLGTPQFTFGTSYQYQIGTEEDDRTPENVKGVQMQYQLTSLETATSPTEVEQAHMDMLMGFWQAVVDEGQAQVALDEPLVPDVTVNSFLGAERKGEKWEQAVKVPFYESKAGKENRMMPPGMYLKCITSGEGEKMVCKTRFYEGEDDKVGSNAVAFIDRRGTVEPLYEYEGIYWGAHGKNSHGASLHFKLVQGIFEESGGGSERVPTRRLVPGGSKGGDTVEEEDGEDEGFEAPAKTKGGDAKNPSAALKAKAKAAPPAAKGKASAKAAPPAPKAKAKAKVAPPAAKGKAKAAPEPEPEEEEDVEEDADAEEDVEAEADAEAEAEEDVEAEEDAE